jgi:hypothetical protein
MARNLSDALRQVLRHEKQARFAAIGALIDTAFEARKAVQVAMPQVLDRPTPFILSSVQVVRPQTLQALSEATSAAGLGPGITGGDLTAIVRIDPDGRGKGAKPDKVLNAEVYGGGRGLKGAERRLQSAGLMLPGSYMVPSRDLLAQANLVDQYGNVRGSFIRSLLSYLQAFTAGQGFTANASQRTRDRIAARGRNASGFAKINGVQYFVSKGRGERNGRLQHLAPGIWAKRGTGGSSVYPVFLFVRAPQYQQRLRFDDIVRNVAERTFPARYQERLARALATAR